MKTLMLALAVATGLLVARLPAQHEGHHPEAAPPAADQTDVKKPAEMKGKEMKGKMMGGMAGGMMGQADTAKLVDQLAKSFAAMEAETDPAALKAKMAEHGALLKELQAKVAGQSNKMEMMQQKMKGGPAKPE